MPPFPGLADVDNCRDWEPGIPIDTARIRPKDEEYWRAHKGTPKAFISLGAGQAIWSNRFGNLTAIRFPLSGTGNALEIESRIRERIAPAQTGLFFQPVRAAALASSRESMDFGQLFIGFSFFLVVAALLLMAMLFVFNLEQRTCEAGLLVALGFSRARVRWLLLIEGFAVAMLGTLAGVGAGAGYTKLALHGLSTVWNEAVNLHQFYYHGEPSTLAIGAVASLCSGLLATWLAGRAQARRAVAELLTQGTPIDFPALRPEKLACAPRKVRNGLKAGPPLRWLPRCIGRAGGLSLLLACTLTVVAIGIIAAARHSSAAFFGAGALMLLAGISFAYSLLVNLSRTKTPATRLATLGIREAARRRGRSLTTVALLASGIFMVISVGAFREDPSEHANERGSGTGGFALLGQTTLPVYEDLNSEAGRRAYNLPSETAHRVNWVPMRLKEGDDASCLNLNRARQPRILGTRPEALASRHSFTFIETVQGAPSGSGWELLERKETDEAVPAIGDEATVRWALGKAVGETLACVDERGNPFQVRIVGMIANSILQGNLVISENAFVQRFPMASGYRVFMIDASRDGLERLASTLSTALQERGLEIVPAWRRLAEFQAVENSYLSIFQALGGLGLLLGSAGMAIVVLRNVAERRNELALLQAVGFRQRNIVWMVVSEHWFLAGLGIVIGVVAALVSVAPSIFSRAVPASLDGTLWMIGLLAASAGLWSWLAARLALRSPILDALRSE